MISVFVYFLVMDNRMENWKILYDQFNSSFTLPRPLLLSPSGAECMSKLDTLGNFTSTPSGRAGGIYGCKESLRFCYGRGSTGKPERCRGLAWVPSGIGNRRGSSLGSWKTWTLRSLWGSRIWAKLTLTRSFFEGRAVQLGRPPEVSRK